MFILDILLLFPLAAALLVSTHSFRAARWILIAFALFYLIHGGSLLALQIAGYTPGYIFFNPYLLYVTIPLGLLLLILAGLMTCCRCCAMRVKKT